MTRRPLIAERTDQCSVDAGNGKFLKSYEMKVDGALVVVKVYIKLNDEVCLSLIYVRIQTVVL